MAERTADYILREMTSPEGGFYSAQDADSEGVEGKYYLFEPLEIIAILGEKAGEEFNRYYDITEKGNFERKSIPNLLRNDTATELLNSLLPNSPQNAMPQNLNACLQTVYEYRKNRYALHLDDKILTSWNGLMIAAMCHLYRVTGNKVYLDAAVKAQQFILNQLCKEETLHVSYRNGRRSEKGFLDDYANEIFALLALYEATLDEIYLQQARSFCLKAVVDFYDEDQGGFFLYGKENEQLILRPKETYDGAVFSGNSAMAYNLVQLSFLTDEEDLRELAKQQLAFLSAEAEQYPAGQAMFLVALLDDIDPPEKITVVVKEMQEIADLPRRVSLDAIVRVLKEPTEEYPLKNDKTTFYVCRGRACQPPVNELNHDWGSWK